MRFLRAGGWGGIILCLSLACQAAETIVLLRHGEKPAAGLGQLSCQGLNRSLALPRVLLSKFGPPTALFAPNPQQGKKDHGQLYSYIRPLATIEPLAIRVGLPVNLDLGFKQIDSLQQKLLASDYQNALLVVAWEHKQAEQLARNLLKAGSADPDLVPTWEADDFDSLYVVTIQRDSTGKTRASFRLDHQRLNPLSAICPESR